MRGILGFSFPGGAIWSARKLWNKYKDENKATDKDKERDKFNGCFSIMLEDDKWYFILSGVIDYEKEKRCQQMNELAATIMNLLLNFPGKVNPNDVRVNTNGYQ